MPACDGLLTSDILFDCDNAMTGGMEVNVLLFNHKDIDKTATTFDPTNRTKMTNFAMKATKKGFLLQGIKQVNALKFELVKKELGPDKYKHTFAGMILNLTAANKLRLLEMSTGGLYAVMVELKWKGSASADAFQLAGYDSGLELMVSTWGSNDNDGNVSIELASKEGYEETTPIVSVFETSYALTSTAFANKFLT
jgi:hypothetical protein